MSWFVEMMQNPDVFSNVLAAAISAFIATMIGIWYSLRERNDTALGKTKLVQGDSNNFEQSSDSIYVFNNSDVTIRNFYVKYKSDGQIKKKRFKTLFPGDFEEIESQYKEPLSNANGVIRKSKLQFFLRSHWMCTQIDKFFAIIAKFFRWIWRGLIFIPAHLSVLRLFFRINSTVKKISKIDDNFLLLCYLNEKIANIESRKTVNYDLKFVLYRSNNKSQMPAFLTATLLKGMRTKNDMSKLYNKYLLSTLDFYIYYFTVYKNMDIQFSQKQNNFDGGRTDSFGVQFKNFKNPENSYFPEKRLSILLTYLLFLTRSDRTKEQYGAFENWLAKWSQISKDSDNALAVDKLKAIYKNKRNYSLDLIKGQDKKDATIVSLNYGKKISFVTMRGNSKFYCIGDLRTLRRLSWFQNFSSVSDVRIGMEDSVYIEITQKHQYILMFNDKHFVYYGEDDKEKNGRFRYGTLEFDDKEDLMKEIKLLTDRKEFLKLHMFY